MIDLGMIQDSSGTAVGQVQDSSGIMQGKTAGFCVGFCVAFSHDCRSIYLRHKILDYGTSTGPNLTSYTLFESS